MFELMVEESFAAAHALREYRGPCENLHGHNWKVQVFLQGEKLNKIGLLEDFKVIKSKLNDVLAEFDHKLLNDIPPFDIENPSSENLAKIIFKKLKKKIKSINKVAVWESPTAQANYWE
ncbi:MAG: 6-carboxytetrahydropterin synthase QueD [Candidatus Margulisbacteria bacterium]|nr:6-carboxytetrahydropterin synthase QueD [Candidatus Margulisiibacteriota bacterium]